MVDRSLADQIRSQANISDRPGQLEALERIANQVQALEAAQRPSLEIETALERAWDDGNATGLDGWIGPGRGAGEIDDQAIYNRDRTIRTAMEKLDVAQRPPLGYVVIAKRPGRNDPEMYEYGVAGSIEPELDPVDNHRAYCEMTAVENPQKYQRTRPVEYVIGEIREVQP